MGKVSELFDTQGKARSRSWQKKKGRGEYTQQRCAAKKVANLSPYVAIWGEFTAFGSVRVGCKPSLPACLCPSIEFSIKYNGIPSFYAN